jgi:26S proteasome regulatory subunit N5
LPLPETETTLAALVVDKTVYARIDRPAGVVDFTKKQGSDEVLNGWSGNVEKMLKLIEATSHLVNKEYAVHAAKLKA